MWRYKTNGIVWDVEIADIDNDNNSEVIVASDKLYVLNKLGSEERSFGQNIKSVEIGDINGDKIKDIIAGQFGGIITAYRGNGLEFWRLVGKGHYIAYQKGSIHRLLLFVKLGSLHRVPF